LQNGERQRQLSKEFVRQWLIENGFQGQEGQKMPNMSEAYIKEVSERYIELFEKITGEDFQKATAEDVAARIEENVTVYLNSLLK
jgi:phosphoribosylaminoimidazole-succinocarboxamide synthase